MSFQAAFLSLSFTVPLQAMERTITDPAALFATCAGRMFAVTEHRWLMGAEDAVDAETAHRHFSALIDATMSDGTGRDILARRVEARADLRALLSEATFRAEGDKKAWLERRVQLMIDECRALLLS